LRKRENLEKRKKMKRSIFHAIFVWFGRRCGLFLKNDLSVRDDRRGSYNLLFSSPNTSRFKKEFPLCPPPSWKKEKKNVLVKTIVKYIYPHYTRYSLSTQRQARQTQIQRHTPFTVGFDVDKFKASSPAQ
jgi:hypothetical protein